MKSHGTTRLDTSRTSRVREHLLQSWGVGFDHGDPLAARSAAVQRELARYGIDHVDGVQVYRWGTEYVPDSDLIDAAGLTSKVVR